MSERTVLLLALLCVAASGVLWVYVCLKQLTYPWVPDPEAESLALMLLLAGCGLGAVWAFIRQGGDS